MGRGLVSAGGSVAAAPPERGDLAAGGGFRAPIWWIRVAARFDGS
jgi:hypothetical protein